MEFLRTSRSTNKIHNTLSINEHKNCMKSFLKIYHTSVSINGSCLHFDIMILWSNDIAPCSDSPLWIWRLVVQIPFWAMLLPWMLFHYTLQLHGILQDSTLNAQNSECQIFYFLTFSPKRSKFPERTLFEPMTFSTCAPEAGALTNWATSYTLSMHLYTKSS